MLRGTLAILWVVPSLCLESLRSKVTKQMASPSDREERLPGGSGQQPEGGF